MKFHLVMQDEVDLRILHETLLHLMTEHPPIVMKITVEFDSATFCDSGMTEEPDHEENTEEAQPPTEWSPNAASPPNNSKDHQENTEETQPTNYEEEV